MSDEGHSAMNGHLVFGGGFGRLWSAPLFLLIDSADHLYGPNLKNIHLTLREEFSLALFTALHVLKAPTVVFLFFL